MTQLQRKTINEMMRQGLHVQLYTAERCWQNNMQYQLESVAKVPGILKELIAKTNREIEAH